MEYLQESGTFCHIPPIRFHKHVCSGGHVGLNFTLLMQSLINVGQDYVPVLLEGLLLVADHGVATRLLMTPWMPIDQHYDLFHLNWQLWI